MDDPPAAPHLLAAADPLPAAALPPATALVALDDPCSNASTAALTTNTSLHGALTVNDRWRAPAP